MVYVYLTPEERNVLRTNITCVLERNSWAYPSRLYRGFALRRKCRLEDVVTKILRRRAATRMIRRRCVDSGDGDAEILRRRCRDGDPTTTMLTLNGIW